MQCDSTSRLLAAFLDNELSGDESAAVREHLKDCSLCSAQIADMARMQRALRGARGHFVPSPEFRRRVQMQIAQPKPGKWILHWIPMAVALGAALAVIALVWVSRSRSYDTLAEVADLHVNAMASTNEVDVVSTDRHTVKPWFQGKIPFTFNLPEFSGTEFTLVGGRLVYFHQQPGAHLIVTQGQHKISVLIFQDIEEMGLGLPKSTSVDRRTSFGLQTWHSANLRFVLISDIDSPNIEKLATLIKQANH